MMLNATQGGPARASLKERKKVSVRKIKSLAAAAADQGINPITVGANLPRAVRARLQHVERKPQKQHATSEKETAPKAPNGIGGGIWLAEMISDMGFTDLELPAVLYSDKKGVSYSSLAVEQGSASPSVAGLKRQLLAAPVRATGTRMPMKEPQRSRLWTSKRGSNNVKAMHIIQQAMPRTLSHN